MPGGDSSHPRARYRPWTLGASRGMAQYANSYSVAEPRGLSGAGAALEAIGMRLGTTMVLELLSAGALKSTDDPWPLLDAILRGRKAPPQRAYKPDVEAVGATWNGLPEE